MDKKESLVIRILNYYAEKASRGEILDKTALNDIDVCKEELIANYNFNNLRLRENWYVLFIEQGGISK